MTSAKTIRIVGSLGLSALVAWAFVMTIWVPLYQDRETTRYVAEQEQPAISAEVGGAEGRTWTIRDRRALATLAEGLRQADYAAAAEPRTDQSFTLRIRRADSRVDEYRVSLDERGSRHDLVVRRGGAAFKTPELRAALRQILQEPAR